MGRLDEEERQIAAFRKRLLAWYARHRRDLPWRQIRDPYAIWVSEIMLQQTRVAVVIERYCAFLQRFPTLISLALAEEQEVLAAWSGLGYYRRARMLHKAAQFVAHQYHGNLPVSSEALRALPGIGVYTAAAIASIAHDECIAVVDGNVERVLCRAQGWDAPGRSTAGTLKRQISVLAARLVDPERAGDFNQALMELGATVCTPRNPRCSACPISRQCKTRGEHKTAPRPVMLSREVAYALALRAKKNPADCEVLLEQRAAELTVMPDLWELPALNAPSVPEPEVYMTLRHAIMHVNYYVRIRLVSEPDIEKLTVRGGRRQWVPVDEAVRMALTGLTRKVLKRNQLPSFESTSANQ